MTEAAPTPDLVALLEHRAWVRYLAGRLLRDDNDVDDVEQDTFAVALRRRPDDPRALRSWLGVVASRFALQKRRGESRRAQREIAVAGIERGERSAADLVAEAEAHGNVVQAVRALAEPYRTTVLMRYFDGLAIAEVARRMDVPLETVRTRLRRAHEQLRASLERDHRRSLALLLAPIAGPGGPPAPTLGDGGLRAAATTTASKSTAQVVALTCVAIGVVAAGAWLAITALDDDTEPATAAAPGDADGGDEGNGAPRGDGGVANPAPPNDGGRPPARSRARANPPPAPAEQPPAQPDAWTAFDLADGRPLAAFALRVRTESGETSVVTDAQGRIPVERTSVVSLTADAAEVWKLALPDKGAVKDEPSVWFWRERAVTGTVRLMGATQPPAPGDVTLAWTRPAGSMTQPDVPGAGFRWMMLRGFDCREERSVDARPDAKGAFSATVPAVRGGALTAEAQGFGPDAAPLAWNDAGECAVTLELRPRVRVVGRLLDASGDPVVGAEVHLNSAVEVGSAVEEERLQAARSRTGGYVFAGRGDGGGTMVLIDSVTTDVRGIFRFEPAALGTAVVSVMKPGFLLCRREIGRLEKDVVGFEMTLAPSEVHVLLTRGGGPVVTRVTVQVADHSESGFWLETDAQGRADAGWLETGRWYRIASGETNACFRWQGQRSIELNDLPKEPTKER